MFPPPPLRLDERANQMVRYLAVGLHRLGDECIALGILLMWMGLGMRDFCLRRHREYND